MCPMIGWTQEVVSHYHTLEEFHPLEIYWACTNYLGLLHFQYIPNRLPECRNVLFSCEMYLVKRCPLGHLHLQPSLFYCRSAKNCKENVGQPKTKVCKLFSRLKAATCITEVLKLNRSLHYTPYGV